MYNHQLDTFIRVADAGSFAKAADVLYISVPAVVQQINLLEERCGFLLFSRSNRGVKLTPAGQSLYDSAKALIAFSDDAMEKAKRLAGNHQPSVRIGTSLLFKCRLLPEYISLFTDQHPGIRIEITTIPNIPMARPLDLGVQYDLQEGIYADGVMPKLCQFLELGRTPLCIAVNRTHPLVKKNKVTFSDLKDQTAIMPIRGISLELDRFRARLMDLQPDVHIIDSNFYGEDTFMQCEVMPLVLITQAVYADIHANLVTIPLATDDSLPYGIMYPIKPTDAVEKFIAMIRDAGLKPERRWLL